MNVIYNKMELTKKGFEYQDSNHAYYMDGKKMTGCTTILGILNKPALVPWSARMAVEYIQKNTQLVTSEETKNNYYLGVTDVILEEAKTAYAKKRDEGAQKGTDTHALVEEYIKDCIANNKGKPILAIRASHSSIQPFMEWAQKEDVTFIASEEKLYSKELFIAGTADFIFEKNGKFYIGDIKTYKKIWDRVPFYQCAGYALMWEEMHRIEEYTRSVITPVEDRIAGYCIFNLPKERAFKEEEDVLWSFDIEGDTKALKACVEIYRQNANFKPNYAKIK